MAGSSFPAPQSAYAQMAGPIVVVGQQFVAPYPIDLVVTKKLLKLGEGHFAVTDVNGRVWFTIKGKLFSIRDRRVILDANGIPIVSLQQKILTAHRRWQAYRGESSSQSDLLFSVKKSSLLQFKTQLDVFLASNTSESVCDFKVKGSFLERSCTITMGETSNIVAQMHRKHSVASIVFDKDTFAVTTYPNVDHAFIVALIVILEEINEDRGD